MATEKISDATDDIADGVASAGQRAGSRARRAGAAMASAAETAGRASEGGIRRGGRGVEAAFDDALGGADSQIGSLQEAIRRNPLASAGAALLIGVVLGRLVL